MDLTLSTDPLCDWRTCTCTQYHMASDTDGELVLLPADFATTRGAHCLDGSAPGYYIRYGKEQ
jgi:hypothetical protein